MEDLGTRSRADIASDHHLAVVGIKLNLKKNQAPGQTALQRFKRAFLGNTGKLNKFKLALNNRFQALQGLLEEKETNKEDSRKGVKEASTSCSGRFEEKNKCRQSVAEPKKRFNRRPTSRSTGWIP
ncbi:unnamed protein product [Schistosoma mattheei]|uniref:Uncharacterized protein n=1 Tax=Schistosoma mattheei TaxID=31246 RepID=A0A183NV37_9TREM|nr:unnamed protein product [Schistosoma mattheei]